MHYNNLYHIFSCYLPLTIPDLRCIYTRSCSYTDNGCPEIKVSPFLGLNTVMIPTLLPEDGKGTISETLCSLEFRTMEEVQKSNIFQSSTCF